MIVVPFIDEISVQNALSQLRISLTYLDLSRRQTFEEFRQILKPEISYSGKDCLILLGDEELEQLSRNKWLDLSSVEQIGWYSDDQHGVNERLLRNLDPQRFENIRQQNPKLKIANFSMLQDSQKLLKQVNVLAGGFGLCYYHFREDYDSFFTRCDVKDTEWLLPRKIIDRNDAAIVAQLLLLDPASADTIGKTLFSNEKNFPTLQTLLKSSFDFFVSESFSVEKYFNKLENEFNEEEETKTIALSLRQLYEGYVRKGLPGFDRSPISAAVRKFIDLAKNDIPELGQVLNNKPDIPKVSLFLLGMMHRADHIEKQFEFGNFIPAFIEFLCGSTESLSISIDDVIISFKKVVAMDKSIRKLHFINQYLLHLKKRSEFQKDLEILELNSDILLGEAKLRELEREIHQIDQESSTAELALKFEGENKKLLQEVKDQNRKIESLEQNITLLKGGKEDIQMELNNKNNQILELRRSFDQLSTENSEQKKEINEKLIQISDQRSRISDLNKHNSRLEIESRELDQKNNQLERDLHDTKARLSEVLISYSALLNTCYAHQHWLQKLINPNKFIQQSNLWVKSQLEKFK